METRISKAKEGKLLEITNSFDSSLIGRLCYYYEQGNVKGIKLFSQTNSPVYSLLYVDVSPVELEKN